MATALPKSQQWKLGKLALLPYDVDVTNNLTVGGTFTVTGVTTYTAPIAYAFATGITAGSTQTQNGATALTKEYNNVTTVTTAQDGVKLPTAVVGYRVTVKNSGANILKVWPATGATIDTLAANLGVSVAAGSEVTFTAKTTTAWVSGDSVLTLVAPTTQTGTLQVKATASAGEFATVITNASQAAARTYTIPDAGANANFLMNQGVNSYSNSAAVTAFNGGGQGSATALTAELNIVTTSTNPFDSVKLPVATAGSEIIVRNNSSNTISVFPATSGTINGMAVNLSVDVPVGAAITFYGISATGWLTSVVVNLQSPSTQKGSLVIKAADSAGNTATTVTNASQAAARTYTIPDAGTNANFVMDQGAQTVAGRKTFSSMPIIPRNAPVSAAGSIISDAAQLSEGFTTVSGANGTVGVALPSAVAGMICIIKGTTSGVLKVWPKNGDSAAINGLGSNNAMSLPTGLIPAIFIADSTTQWYTIPLVPS